MRKLPYIGKTVHNENSYEDTLSGGELISGFIIRLAWFSYEWSYEHKISK